MRKHLLLAALCSLFLFNSCDPNQETANDSAIIELLEEAIQYEIDDKGLPSFAITLVKGDAIIYENNFGLERISPEKKADENTVYRIGSVSKLFTDIAIMQLVEKGEIDLDADVSSYLPGFKPDNKFDKQISLRHLMSHRSGLIREPRIGSYFDDTSPSLQQTIKSLDGAPLVYEPDTRTKYSNAGIAVVGYVLENKMNEPFAEYLNNAVLQPMGLKGSSFAPNEFVEEHLAYGEMWSYDGRRFAAPTFELGMAPAGSMYSTIGDLGKFMVVLLNKGVAEDGRVIESETLDMMWTPQFGGNYGIGFNLDELEGKKTVGHGGAIYGFATQLTVVPEMNMGAAGVSTKDIANSVTTRLVNYSLELMMAAENGEELPKYETTDELDMEMASQFIGDYESPRGNRVRIEWLNEELVMKSGSTELKLKQNPEKSLALDGPIANGLVLDFNADGFVAREEQFSKVEPGIPEDRNEYAEYIGEYGWDHNVLFTFLDDNGDLNVLTEWFFKYKLLAVTKDLFSFPESGLYHGEKLKFNRNENGQIVNCEIESSVVFPKRATGDATITFRIDPIRPVDDLRKEALEAQPPSETGKKEADFIEPSNLDATIKLDIRYASTNNFMSTQFYTQPRAFLQRPAGIALLEASKIFNENGVGILIHDAYRPWYVTKMFWDATPEDKKIFVANPANGSRHNRGCAIDMTLYDLQTGETIEMVAGYDEMSERSYPNYIGGTAKQRYYRRLLRETMESVGFTVYEFEWWHFDYKTWNEYPILNLRFEELNLPAQVDKVP